VGSACQQQKEIEKGRRGGGPLRERKLGWWAEREGGEVFLFFSFFLNPFSNSNFFKLFSNHYKHI
jgi:hypothetical protein